MLDSVTDRERMKKNDGERETTNIVMATWCRRSSTHLCTVSCACSLSRLWTSCSCMSARSATSVVTRVCSADTVSDRRCRSCSYSATIWRWASLLAPLAGMGTLLTGTCTHRRHSYRCSRTTYTY